MNSCPRMWLKRGQLWQHMRKVLPHTWVLCGVVTFAHAVILHLLGSWGRGRPFLGGRRRLIISHFYFGSLFSLKMMTSESMALSIPRPMRMDLI